MSTEVYGGPRSNAPLELVRDLARDRSAGANKVAVQVISDDSDILRAARALAPLI